MNIKNNKTAFLIVIAFLLAGFFLINFSLKNIPQENIKYVKIGETKVRVELALTGQEQMQGLSGRENLKDDEGMLFVFTNPNKYYFWMKGMNFAIDMIWLGEDMRIIYIKKDAKPENFLDTYGPDLNSKYVLEVVSGFSDKNNLKVGDIVEFLYHP